MTSTLHIARPHAGGFPRTFCGRDLSTVSHWANITDVPPYFDAGREPWPACRACLRALSATRADTEPGGTPQDAGSAGSAQDGSQRPGEPAAPDSAGSHDARRATLTRSNPGGSSDTGVMIQSPEDGSQRRMEGIPSPATVARLVNSRAPRARAASILARHRADCAAGRDLRWTRRQLSALVAEMSR